MTTRIRKLMSQVAVRSKTICQAALVVLAAGSLAQAGSPGPVFAAVSVPEIDAGSAASALALVVGSAFLFKEKLAARKRDR